MRIDPHFESSVVAEFRLRERRAGRRDESHGAHLLAQKPHHGRPEVTHLRRVAHALPARFRAVAWLHHAHVLLEERLDGARPIGEALSPLRLLPDPGPGT